MKKLLLAPAVVLAMLAIAPGSALAATRVVDNDKVQCPNAQFLTIQAAVTASGPGDRVDVCPGTYSETVVVPSGKNNLDIFSRQPLAAVIKAPASIAVDLANDKSIVRITQSRNVSVRRFKITGPGPGPCDSIRNGVRVDGNGSANILSNHITEIRDMPFSGCQNGLAIRVGRRSETQTGDARIVGNLIDKYQKNGPTIDGPESSAFIAGNTILGAGPTPVTAQNGIQVSREATATVEENRVRDNAYIVPLNLPAFTASGILLFEAGRVRVEENSLRGNQDGIALYTMNGRATVEENSVIGGIGAIDPTLGTLVFGDGIYAADDTANNRIEENFLRDNREHDCHDDSTGSRRGGVANFWIDNDGRTENKPGLCVQDDNDDDHDDDDDDDDRRSSLMR